MRLKRASIRNFKGLAELDLDFSGIDNASARQLTALLGDNGSGKTTALQALALPLSLATRRTPRAEAFEWQGFLLERVSTLGPTMVEIDVVFDQEELDTTYALYEEWLASRPREWVESHQVIAPTKEPEVQIGFGSGKLRCNKGYGGLNQFLGRYYIKTLARQQPSLRAKFKEVGDVFWFDQFRNLGSPMSERGESAENGYGLREGWAAGVERLREYLVGWWGYHTSPNRRGGKDYIPELEEGFCRVFPGTQFRGIQPRDSSAEGKAADFYFLLERDSKVYDIAEMSSGEQGVFPLVYEFVRLDIAKSVVLIDELELHLHPPEQQALLAALPRIGADCQFVISTHSSYLTDVIPAEQEVRLTGGRRCL